MRVLEKLPEFDDGSGYAHSGDWTTDDNDEDEKEFVTNSAVRT